MHKTTNKKYIFIYYEIGRQPFHVSKKSDTWIIATAGTAILQKTAD